MEFFNSFVAEKAITLAKEVLRSGFVSEGEMVRKFENGLTKKLGHVNPVAVNSGTSALHLGLTLAGVGPDDEVILPAQTFVASGLAVLMTGAMPIFADIQYETGNIDPESIKHEITDKTKAIMPVHWAGYPCDMDEINEIADNNNLVVIEDAAHALGASYNGKPIGSISDFTAFSFQAIKHLTTGDGGALCCLDDNHYREARNRRWFGIDRKNSKPSVLGERLFDVKKVGYKYHMNDIAAAIGLGNLEVFAEKLKSRRDIADIYRKELKNISGLQLLDYKDDRQSAYWLFTILVENRLEFINRMKEAEIPVSVVHRRIDRFSVFDRQTTGLVNQEKFDENQIAIPIHSGLTDENIHRIISSVNSGW
jgi:perosamine synthetase